MNGFLLPRDIGFYEEHRSDVVQCIDQTTVHWLLPLALPEANIVVKSDRNFFSINRG